MATTTNFGWETPDDTDLVKDGALAMRTLGNAIDASLVDLKGGTTGQVLSKTSNTDMDFTWVTSDDANAIQNAIVDAKGDLITATAADTPARLAVGSNGDTLVADSAATTGLRWQGNYAAAKNKILNSDFSIWQRGTTTSTAGFLADRWNDAWVGDSAVYSQQTFTAGTAPVAGYEGQYFARVAVTSSAGAGNYNHLKQMIEDVRTFAGQTVTISYWAKADATKNISLELQQFFGSGGSSNVNTFVVKQSITTSWARYSHTVSVPSISSKTIGAGSALDLRFWLSAGSNFDARTSSLGQQNITFDVWGVQVEAGSVATAFQTATGTLQGEIAACQRYYWRANVSAGNYLSFATGQNYSTTQAYIHIPNPVAMRTGAASVDYANLGVTNSSATPQALTAFTLNFTGPLGNGLAATVASGLVAGNATILSANNSTAAYVAFSAEL